ncbi:hypothetical protein CVS40_12527 [Lucilia cuprina]|nr:hypothetical protein CVS40_12527 [Lucilia cuprina]
MEEEMKILQRKGNCKYQAGKLKGITKENSTKLKSWSSSRRVNLERNKLNACVLTKKTKKKEIEKKPLSKKNLKENLQKRIINKKCN